MGTVMTEGSELQPKEVERTACSTCGSFLKLEKSIGKCIGHPRFDIMRCVSWGSFQWPVEEKG
jgi:hypothetical protein